LITVTFKNVILNNEVNLDNSASLYIEISGHAGFSKKGNDIVCSAVSILSETFILTVARILKIKQKTEKKDGFLSSLILLEKVSTEDKVKLKLLIESLLVGLLEINKEFPDKVKIDFVN
jgi:uncharacterized protein